MQRLEDSWLIEWNGREGRRGRAAVALGGGACRQVTSGQMWRGRRRVQGTARKGWVQHWRAVAAACAGQPQGSPLQGSTSTSPGWMRDVFVSSALADSTSAWVSPNLSEICGGRRKERGCGWVGQGHRAGAGARRMRRKDSWWVRRLLGEAAQQACGAAGPAPSTAQAHPEQAVAGLDGVAAGGLLRRCRQCLEGWRWVRRQVAPAPAAAATMHRGPWPRSPRQCCLHVFTTRWVT